jgi:hypothetical protein
LDRWLATLVKLELIHISPFVILIFFSSEFVEFLIGYSPPSSHIRTFQRRAARVHGASYDKIREALEELEPILHPNEEQEQLREVLRTTAPRAHGERTHSRLPARTASHEQDVQSQRRSAFERLGTNGRQNREKRRNHTQSNQIEHSREERSKAYHRSSPRFIPRLNNNWQEEGVESEHREVGTHNRFPYFLRRFASVQLPHKFKPSNHSKYHGKTEPKQWLIIYSQSIKLAGGDDDIKALFFPIALQNMPLHGSIN